MEPICETTLFFAGLFMSELPWSDSKIWAETLFPHFLKKHIKCFKLIKLVSFRVYSLQARSLYLHYRLDIPRHSKCMNQNIKPVTFQNTLKSWHFFTLWIFLSLKMPCFLSFLCNHKRQTTFFFLQLSSFRSWDITGYCLVLAEWNICEYEITQDLQQENESWQLDGWHIGSVKKLECKALVSVLCL